MSASEAIARLQALITARPALADPLKGLTDPAIAAERLAGIAGENGITIEAAALLAYFEAAIANAHASGALSDEQLDGVAGGGTARQSQSCCSGLCASPDPQRSRRWS
jgi:hypothetical protein